MIYEWVVDSSTVTEERMQEIAAEKVGYEEMEDALHMLVDEHGFSWLLKQLKEEAWLEVVDLAKETYIEEYFTEVEDEYEENEDED